MAISAHAAIDLGASSGRVVLGRIGPDTLDLEEVARFPNPVVSLPDGLHWNVVGLFDHALQGVAAAARSAVATSAASTGGLQSVGIDSWAVDYGLLKKGAQAAAPAGSAAAPETLSLINTPFHYRDDRTGAGVESVHGTVDFAQLYQRNGLQFLPFNTLYQLAVESQLDSADRLLLIPDLLGYWLTGAQYSEITNASTTGLVDVHTGQWDTELMAQLGLSPELFAPLAAPGTLIGTTRPALTDALGGAEIPVTLVGSHDTASAVVGTPLSTPDAAYISCGTWGLVGLELSAPVVSDAAREANFTNEGGVDGTTRFLTNVMGTWLLSETLRTWQARTGDAEDLVTLLHRAAEVPAGQVVVFDVSDPRFIPPGDMPERIADWCTEHGQQPPQHREALIRSVVESIAAGFAAALRDAAILSGRTIDVVHMVGGGSLNALLCQATADRSGVPVIAGPVEATAIGNLLIQARTAGTLRGDLADLRSLISRTHEPTHYQPRG